MIPEQDFFQYDPIAENNVEIQSISAQIGNLLFSLFIKAKWYYPAP